MSGKCKHGFCLLCGDLCPECGFDESKYNLGSSPVCDIRPTRETILKNKSQPTIVVVRGRGGGKRACPYCSKSVSEMTAPEKDRFFETGRCGKCQ